VRVIDEKGEQLGVLLTWQAINMARERDLDLVEVAPNSVPPVCRFMDYGKFHFEQEKKEREAKRTQRGGTLSEIRFRPRIAQHDRDSKLRHARELLGERHKVKLTVQFRGREMQHPERGVELLKSLSDALKEDGKLESAPLMEGRMLSVILAPAPKREAAPAAAPAKDGKQAKEEIPSGEVKRPEAQNA
jgi:translation initiation factor IF-3